MSVTNMFNTLFATAHDSRFSKGFKTTELISLTNFGTAFGMGMIVIICSICLYAGRKALAFPYPKMAKTEAGVGVGVGVGILNEIATAERLNGFR
ncbi:hypothetical protein M3P05_11735 [Sansalvadorimonas sp. 2012CJ34-2]|uniref:Uncharacterized protein n=1 Tax=Parendozoicomonas callyspongiae TaxID=2942213 RepID=A0ABT0PGZ7_9GAMM|nr:hypothetical protein [Sansalvadorimonas sp. 2012CJ34-2]MCL6270595.1 hypothetical protein [Sansalvadorimonas sp. 2012CJ34-2]